jgi:hypothetical protein
MKIYRYVIIFAWPLMAFSQNFTAKKFVDSLVLPHEIGQEWSAINPENWPTGTNSHIVAMYERKREDGKADSVIADIFLFNTPEQAAEMLKLRRQQVAAGQGMLINELSEIGEGAFSSIHEGEKMSGRRVTFRCRNAVITLSPSPHSIGIAKIFTEKLR